MFDQEGDCHRYSCCFGEDIKGKIPALAFNDNMQLMCNTDNMAILLKGWGIAVRFDCAQPSKSCSVSSAERQPC